jgi:Protein of unknown function (DUF1573)
MRYLLTCFLFAALIAGGCNDPKGQTAGPATGSNAVMDSTTIQWLDSTRDFGKIQEGQKLEVSFRFKNTGDKPLVIDRVQPSCGCTVADQSKEPIAPGAQGQIKAVFNSEGHPGTNHKTLFVYSNTKGTRNSALQFVVEVEKKK